MSAAFMPSGGMDRAFSPHRIHLALNLGRWPRLVWQRAFGPQIRKDLQCTASSFFRANGASEAPTARLHNSLGQRPRYAAPNIRRTKGPPHTSEGQWPSTGASPQELSRTPNQRAEGPNQPIARNDGGYHFRGVTKMITHRMDRAFSPQSMRVARSWGDAAGTGIKPGLWPSKTDRRSKPLACPFLPRPRRIAIPAWGNAPGQTPTNRMRAEGPIHLSIPCPNHYPFS